MDELRVPTVPIVAEVTTADGRTMQGQFFVPPSASSHSGPMRAEEWLNQASLFFAFRPDEVELPVILNKRQLLVVSVDASDNADPAPEEESPRPVEAVVVECGGRRLEGSLSIEMPENQRRVLDFLNRPEPFVTIRERDRHHIVAKRHIVRLMEVRDA